MPFTYEFPRPSVSTDCLVFAVEGNELQVLLIKRGHDPFAGNWALPGGFLGMNEDLETCARRELMEETGIKSGRMKQLHTFGAVDRDPRGRVISIGFMALVNKSKHQPAAGDDASDARWFTARRLPKLAFDHRKFIKIGLEQLHECAQRRPIGIEVMPKQFPIGDLQSLYEAILGRTLNAANFRRTILATGFLAKAKKNDLHYQIDRTVYKMLQKSGYGKDMFPM